MRSADPHHTAAPAWPPAPSARRVPEVPEVPVAAESGLATSRARRLGHSPSFPSLSVVGPGDTNGSSPTRVLGHRGPGRPGRAGRATRLLGRGPGKKPPSAGRLPSCPILGCPAGPTSAGFCAIFSLTALSHVGGAGMETECWRAEKHAGCKRPAGRGPARDSSEDYIPPAHRVIVDMPNPDLIGSHPPFQENNQEESTAMKRGA